MRSETSTRSGAGGVSLFDDVRPDEAAKAYLPGMRRAWLMPWYDVYGVFHRAGRMYRRTVELAGITSGQRVLDVGCGTGNLALTVLRTVPDAVVTGVDPDGAALRRAARKARRRRVGRTSELTLVRGFADRLPAADASLDHVVSSLALHHLPREEKERFAAELVRVLRPGGRVTIADLGGHRDGEHGHQHGVQHGDGDGHHGEHRHGGEHRRRHRHEPGSQGYREDNADAGIERLLTSAGLQDAREVGRMTLMGTEVLFVQARRG